MTDGPRALVYERFEEVWNQGREDAIDRMFPEDGIAHGLKDAQGNELRGPCGGQIRSVRT
jgi:hypothetical protein